MSLQSLSNALWAEHTRLSKLPAIERGRQAQQLIVLLKRAEERAAKQRRAAFVESQEAFGSSYADLAAIFGCTRQRAYEIINGRRSHSA